MKTRKTLWGLLLFGAIFSSVSCSDDDDDDFGKVVPQPVKEAFAKDYPNASEVSWEVRLNYYVAEFFNAVTRAESGRPQTEAWYTGVGKNEMEKTDVMPADLPARYPKVAEAWKEDGKYGQTAGFVLDEAEYVRRGNDERLVLEVEKGEMEYDLTYTLDGVLLKASLDDDGNDGELLPFPDGLTGHFQRLYGPSVVFQDFEKEGAGYKLELLLPVGAGERSYFMLEQEFTYVLKDGKFVEKENEIEIDEEEMAAMLTGLVKDNKEMETVVMQIFGFDKPAPWTEEDVERLALTFEQDVKSYDIFVKKGGKALFSLLLNKDAQKEFVYEIKFNAVPL